MTATGYISPKVPTYSGAWRFAAERWSHPAARKSSLAFGPATASLRTLCSSRIRPTARCAMIRKLVDFALNHRFLILAAALLLIAWGVVSFHNLPVEAYPDVASNYVEIVTQWPGRAAEEVEQQVTIPIEIAVNGIPHLEHLRSITIFGLSSLILIFDDESENNWNRQKVAERLADVELPQDLKPEIGADFSPVGEIFFYTLRSTNPNY